MHKPNERLFSDNCFQITPNKPVVECLHHMQRMPAHICKDGQTTRKQNASNPIYWTGGGIKTDDNNNNNDRLTAFDPGQPG